MSNPTDFYKINVSASATINGSVIPISGFSLDYHLDQIPYAFVTIPLGRNAVSGQKVVDPSTLATTLVPFTPIQINLTTNVAKGTDGPTQGLPGGTKLVFEGYIIRPGFTRTTSVIISFISAGESLSRSST